jgi:hypothetical protein
MVTNSDGSALPVPAPGYVNITGMVTPVSGSLAYNFLVSDSSTPQQTAAFRITCTP